MSSDDQGNESASRPPWARHPQPASGLWLSPPPPGLPTHRLTPTPPPPSPGALVHPRRTYVAPSPSPGPPSRLPPVNPLYHPHLRSRSLTASVNNTPSPRPVTMYSYDSRAPIPPPRPPTIYYPQDIKRIPQTSPPPLPPKPKSLRSQPVSSSSSLTTPSSPRPVVPDEDDLASALRLSNEAYARDVLSSEEQAEREELELKVALLRSQSSQTRQDMAQNEDHQPVSEGAGAGWDIQEPATSMSMPSPEDLDLQLAERMLREKFEQDLQALRKRLPVSPRVEAATSPPIPFAGPSHAPLDLPPTYETVASPPQDITAEDDSSINTQPESLSEPHQSSLDTSFNPEHSPSDDEGDAFDQDAYSEGDTITPSDDEELEPAAFFVENVSLPPSHRAQQPSEPSEPSPPQTPTTPYRRPPPSRPIPSLPPESPTLPLVGSVERKRASSQPASLTLPSHPDHRAPPSAPMSSKDLPDIFKLPRSSISGKRPASRGTSGRSDNSTDSSQHPSLHSIQTGEGLDAFVAVTQKEGKGIITGIDRYAQSPMAWHEPGDPSGSEMYPSGDWDSTFALNHSVAVSEGRSASQTTHSSLSIPVATIPTSSDNNIAYGISWGYSLPMLYVAPPYQPPTPADPLPSVITLYPSSSAPYHIESPDFKSLLRFLASHGEKRVEPSPEVFPFVEGPEIHLRVVIHLIKHPYSGSWRTVLYLMVHRALPKNSTSSILALSPTYRLPFGFTTPTATPSPPNLFAAIQETSVSVIYTLPPPFPSLPITLDRLVMYISAVWDESQRSIKHPHKDDTPGLKRLAKSLTKSYHYEDESWKNDLGAEVDASSPINRANTVGGFLAKVMGKGKGKVISKSPRANEGVYEYVTPWTERGIERR